MTFVQTIVIAYFTLISVTLAQANSEFRILDKNNKSFELHKVILKPTNITSTKIKAEILDLSKMDIEGIEDKRAIKFFDKPLLIWEVKDGYFVSYNGGEFGGALFLFSIDGSKRILILAEHVSEILSDNNKSYFVSGGINHLGESGGVYKIMKNKKSMWQSEALFQSPFFTPSIIGQLPNKSILITSRHGLLTELRPDGWMKQRWSWRIKYADNHPNNMDPFKEQ